MFSRRDPRSSFFISGSFIEPRLDLKMGSIATAVLFSLGFKALLSGRVVKIDVELELRLGA